MSELADALGWYSIPIPDLAVDATAEVVQRLPLPAATAWIHSVRKPVLMKTDRAQKQLGGSPSTPQGDAEGDGATRTEAPAARRGTVAARVDV